MVNPINMLNEEIYQELCKLYTREDMKLFTAIITDLYDIRANCINPPPTQGDLYELHFWKLKNIHLNITTNEDGTDRQDTK